MDFRRSGQLDERRRRVLMDEIASPADPENPEASAATSGSARGPVRAYSAAVLSERQPRVTDLLPVRPLWVIVALVIGLVGIAAIEAIHIRAAKLTLNEDAAQLAALDARQRGSIAAWYSSAMLAAAAALALVVFGIRSHRVDDYRGRYRSWLWTAAALTWLSLDAATSIHDCIAWGLTLLAGKQVLTASLTAGSTVTWIAVYGLVFGTLGLRLAMEVWPSLLSFAALLLAGLLYLCGALLELELIAAPASMTAGVIGSTTIMLAHFALLATVGFYARHVYLDATGRLKVHIDPDRKGKSKRTKLKVVKSEKPEPKPAPASTPSATPSRFGSAPASTAAVKPGASISRSNVSTSNDDDEEEDDDASSYGGEPLSRSERRRLKKLARREQQRRAA